MRTWSRRLWRALALAVDVVQIRRQLAYERHGAAERSRLGRRWEVPR